MEENWKIWGSKTSKIQNLFSNCLVLRSAATSAAPEHVIRSVSSSEYERVVRQPFPTPFLSQKLIFLWILIKFRHFDRVARVLHILFGMFMLCEVQYDSLDRSLGVRQLYPDSIAAACAGALLLGCVQESFAFSRPSIGFLSIFMICLSSFLDLGPKSIKLITNINLIKN